MNDINDKNKIAKCKMQNAKCKKKDLVQQRFGPKKDLVQQRFDLKNKK